MYLAKKGSQVLVFQLAKKDCGFASHVAKDDASPYVFNMTYRDVVRAGKVMYYLAYDGAVYPSNNVGSIKLTASFAQEQLCGQHSYLKVVHGFGIGDEFHVPVEAVTNEQSLSYWGEQARKVFSRHLLRKVCERRYYPDSGTPEERLAHVDHIHEVGLMCNSLLSATPEQLTVEQWNERLIGFFRDEYKGYLTNQQPE